MIIVNISEYKFVMLISMQEHKKYIHNNMNRTKPTE